MTVLLYIGPACTLNIIGINRCNFFKPIKAMQHLRTKYRMKLVLFQIFM